MQVLLIHMVPHLSLLYYASLPLWTYSYLTKASTLTTVPSYSRHYAGGISVLWTHLSILSSFLLIPITLEGYGASQMTSQQPLSTLSSFQLPFFFFLSLCPVGLSLLNQKYNQVVLGWAYRGLTGGFLLLQAGPRSAIGRAPDS